LQDAMLLLLFLEKTLEAKAHRKTQYTRLKQLEKAYRWNSQWPFEHRPFEWA